MNCTPACATCSPTKYFSIKTPGGQLGFALFLQKGRVGASHMVKW
ncbi:MAG TPA: hypothetical protein VFR86_16560 [Burkholderiaceae bacterium]|nr:hypothetical protein [Burkholderiaceae bacterium]